MLPSRLDAKEVLAALSAVPSRLWRLRWLFLAVYLPVAALLAAIVVVRAIKGVPLQQFTRDPSAVTGESWYYGAVSQLGLALWAVTLGIYFLSAMVLLRAKPSLREKSLFFASIGLLTAYILFDDMFMLHEIVLPQHLGIDEKLVYAVLAICLVAIGLRFASVILDSDFALLLVAGAGLSISILIDILFDSDSFHGAIFLEDCFKFAGIVAWTLYAFSTCMRALSPPQDAPSHAREGSISRLRSN